MCEHQHQHQQQQQQLQPEQQRVVRFCDSKDKIHEILSCDDYTPDELYHCWYTPDELLDILDDIESTVRQASGDTCHNGGDSDQRHHDKNVCRRPLSDLDSEHADAAENHTQLEHAAGIACDELCTRGLERCVSHGSMLTKKRVRRACMAVMAMQEIHMEENGELDDEEIADVYLDFTEESIEEAIQLAEQDAVDARQIASCRDWERAAMSTCSGRANEFGNYPPQQQHVQEEGQLVDAQEICARDCTTMKTMSLSSRMPTCVEIKMHANDGIDIRSSHLEMPHMMAPLDSDSDSTSSEFTLSEHRRSANSDIIRFVSAIAAA